MSDSNGGIEGNRWRDAMGENMTDNTEESEREEEGGSNYSARSESEGGSEPGWKQERDRMLSGEDGFVTMSSGGDEEDDREEDEEEFEDCQDFWEGGVAYDDPSPGAFKEHEGDEERQEEWTMRKDAVVDEDDQGKEKQTQHILVGQTLHWSKNIKKSPSQVDQAKGMERDNPNLKSHHQYSDEATWKPQDDWHLTLSRDGEYPIINNQDTESKSGFNILGEERPAIGETTEMDIKLHNTEIGEGTRPKKEHPYAEIGPINRDSQTERLLIEWREKNKEVVETEQFLPVPSNPYADVSSQVDLDQIQPILDGIDTRLMSAEQVEAIRIRLSGAWSMSEEPKRHSQAPHLKWAKNVVREILGNSEEQIVDELNAEVQGDQGVKQSGTAIKNDRQQVELAQETDEIPDVKFRMDEQHSDPELEEEEPLEVEGLRGMGQSQADMHADQFTAMHGDTSTYTHADTPLYTEGKEDHSMDEETDPSGHLQLEKVDIQVKICEEADDDLKLLEMEKEARREKEVEMYLSVSNTLYKPNSCPILSYETESDLFISSKESEGQELEDTTGESEEERQVEESEDRDTAEEVGSIGEVEGTEVDSEDVAEKKIKGGTLTSSFQDSGPEARLRRRGIRKTTERRNGEHLEAKEEEGVGRDRRTRIFSTTGKERMMEMQVLCSNEFSESHINYPFSLAFTQHLICTQAVFKSCPLFSVRTFFLCHFLTSVTLPGI